MHNSGNLDDSFLFDSPTPSGTRYTRSPSVSSLPVPAKPKSIARREISNNNLPRFTLSPFTPDYSRPHGYGLWNTFSPRGHVPSSIAALVSPPQPTSALHSIKSSAKGSASSDPLRRSNSFQGDYSSPTIVRSTSARCVDPLLVTSASSPAINHKSTPSSPSSQSPPVSPALLRSVSLSKDFSQTILNANNDAGESTLAYPSSPPPSPPVSQSGSSLAAKRKIPQLESLRLDRSSSTISSTSPSPTSSFRLDFTPNEDDRDVSYVSGYLH